MGHKYAIYNQQAIHFITFAVVQWVDVLSRPEVKDIVIDSLRHCQKEKGLDLHAYVIMSNHVHLIASARENYRLSDILRDLKKFTSKRIYEFAQESTQESRKNWMLWLFKSNGQQNANNKNFQVWQQDNHPIELTSNEMMDQRLNYLHENPVRAGLVYEPEHYVYSSAIDYAGGKGLLDLVFLD